MRRIITIALMLCLMVMPCNALTLFKADYDGDTYTEETAYLVKELRYLFYNT